MTDTCQNCGLPKELCVCITMGIDDQKITIYIDKRSYGKSVTIVEGIDDKNAKDLVKMLKSKLACGGTHKEKRIEQRLPNASSPSGRKPNFYERS